MRRTRQAAPFFLIFIGIRTIGKEDIEEKTHKISGVKLTIQEHKLKLYDVDVLIVRQRTL